MTKRKQQPKEKQCNEVDYLKSLTAMLETWDSEDVVKNTVTYRRWQHDKGSFAFGYGAALREIRLKIRERLSDLKK